VIRYSRDSQNDLREIVDYTVDRCGEAQAVLYLDSLFECFDGLEHMPGMGRACLDIYPALYRIEQGQHVIFYLPESEGIFICRVLHKRMLIEYGEFQSSFSESIE